ncbi:MAG TPA: AMP-binding protein [Pyrinomonadaceae bacterium]|nr:AMP-binding protein [Pyrinomonadaceae bacterium]
MNKIILKNLVNPVKTYVERSTLLSFLDNCIAHGDETAVAHWRGLRTVRWTYARLASAAFQFARELEVREIGAGDRVLFWGENSPEWIAAFYGCLLRGAIVVPLDLKSAPDFVERVQQQVSAKLLLAENQPHLQLPRLAFSTLESHIARHSTARYSTASIKPDDLIEIVFTSGTTAEPKGVCLTHRNLLTNIAPIEKEFKRYARWERLVHPLRFLCLLPLSHVFGQLMGIFIPQFLGAEVYFRESYKPSEIVAAVKKDRINVVVTVPRVLETLQEKVKIDAQISDHQLAAARKRHFLRNWWTFRKVHRQFGWRFWAFISGGATLEAETETFWRCVGYAIIQGYGMTETASLTSLSHPFRMRQGSIGKPVGGQEVKLSDDGEILVRGANISPGYWNRNGDSLADEEGWIHTGDIGEIGPDGHIYFRGRSKETIVTAAGLKIYPTDLEAALDRQPEIKASTVIPINGGTEALAVLIPHDKSSDLQAAVQRANESLAEFQRIRYWVEWPGNDFPRTTGTRKVIKGKVAEAVKPLLKQSAKDNVAEVAAPLSLPVISRIAKLQPGGLSLSANLSDDLKLDSLGRVELLSALEDQYQIELDEAAITEATTLGDIEQIVSRGKSTALPYPYPRWAMRFPMRWIRPFVYQIFLLPLTLIMCRVRVVDKERLATLDPSKPVLFIANHVTDVDAGLILSALPFRWRRRLAIAMSGEYLRDWRFGGLKAKIAYALAAGLFNVFSLPRQSGFRQSFTYAGEAVDRGWSILIFPEGTETKDGNMQPFKAGIGLLASELNVTVVPIKLDGLFELKGQHQYFIKPGTVSVTFGDPIQFSRAHTPTDITTTLEHTLKSF